MGTVLFLFAISMPFFVLVIAAAVYINDRELRSGKGRSIALYCAGISVSGIAGAMLAALLLVPMFCSFYHGDQCGFGAGVILMPIAFSLATAMFLYKWKKRNHG